MAVVEKGSSRRIKNHSDVVREKREKIKGEVSKRSKKTGMSAAENRRENLSGLFEKMVENSGSRFQRS